MGDLDETVTAAQDGCPDAFGDLVRATYDDTYSLALRLVGNPEDAQDVAQDTYLRAFRAIGRFRGESSIATWLYRITTNCATTLIARRRRVNHDRFPDEDAVVDDCPEHDPQLRADAAELRERVIVALGALPVKLRSVIVLRDIYDLSHDAIARQLDITESAAKVRLHRARQKLRAALFDASEASAMPPGAVAEVATTGSGMPLDRAAADADADAASGNGATRTGTA